mgnify:CR=1 FL=1|jgi:CRISPR-associated endonuclease/helicase Cas3
MLQSHPHQSIAQHLCGVWKNAEVVIKRHGGKFWEGDILLKTSIIMCLCHDLGKSTSYFQKYMGKITQGKKIKGGHQERHSLLSAIIGYNLAKKFLEEINCPSQFLSFYVFVAIKEHHGNLIDFLDEKNNISQENLELLKIQASSIDYAELANELEPLLFLLPDTIINLFPLTKEEILNWVNDFNHDLYLLRKDKKISLPKRIQEQYSLEKLQAYFNFCFLYSLLLEGDKSQAGLGKSNSKIKELQNNLVDIYKSSQDWSQSKLNNLRQKAYEEVADNIQLCKGGSLFSIILPTGLGKTLTAYNYALKLREVRKKERNGIPPRIIYSLPFLSVIDQNLKIFEEILQSNGIDYDNTYILKHHYLSNSNYNEKSEREELDYNPNASKLLVEGWNSEIIVTTFIQLFETMISHKNRSLRRFHKLSNAIILVDEIQAIPIKYWELIRWIFLFIANELNTDIILITATVPKIFLPEDGLIELCQSEQYFLLLDRIEMQIDLRKLTLEQFVEELSIDEDKSYLFILNTIGSARKLYQSLSEKIEESIGFLSTQVIMKHRKKRIEAVKESFYRIVVSTQMVEAGVDIDFDIVYRDFAPLDSINQSAGRCNRNNRPGLKGEVRVVRLWNGKQTYGEYIYDPILLRTTEKVLENKKNVREMEFSKLIDQYFGLLRKRANQEESQLILKSIEELCFDSFDGMKLPISKFKLIEEQSMRENIFIEVDEDAQYIWRKYEELLLLDDPFERQQEFSAIKSEFYNYIISIPITYSMPPEIKNFRYVARDVLEIYYDIETGYRDKTGTMIW